MQNSTCITKILFKHTENSSGKWTIFQCIICDSSNYRYTRTQIQNFTLVSEIHDNVDLVMGMKNIFELEGVIDSRESCFSFLSRSIPFFPVTTVEIAPASQKMVMVDAPFVEELSGMAMVKILT